MSKCVISGCDNEIQHKKAKLCGACYSSIYYWTRKTPTALMHRISRLRVFEARMESVAPSNVRLLRRRA